MLATYLIFNILLVSVMFIQSFLPVYFKPFLVLLDFYHFFCISAVHAIVFICCSVYKAVVLRKEVKSKESISDTVFLLVLLGVAIILNLVAFFMYWNGFIRNFRVWDF